MAVMTSRFADGLAVGSDLVEAAEHAVGQALSRLSGPADLVCFFICGDDPEDVARAGQAAMKLAPEAHVIGCSATGVIGDGQGVELTPAVSAWAATLEGARLTTFTLETLTAEDRFVVVGLPERGGDDHVAVLLADPYTFPTDAFVERSVDVLGDLPLIGGLANGLQGRGSVRLFADGEIYTEGAIGVLLSGPVKISTVVSQGCRPIGPAWWSPRSEENLLHELAGQPALARLEDIVSDLRRGRPRARRLAACRSAWPWTSTPNATTAAISSSAESSASTPSARPWPSATSSRSAGPCASRCATPPPPTRTCTTCSTPTVKSSAGWTGRCCSPATGGARPCSARPTTTPVALRDTLGPIGVAGFFAAGEIGPVAGHNHVHGFTASILVFSSTWAVRDVGV